MQTKVQKWGNSLAIRIPKTIAKETKLTDGKQVELVLEKENLVIKPVRKKKKYALTDLLAAITDENCHAETDFGNSVGKEIW
jgi:antitoxin MazE